MLMRQNMIAAGIGVFEGVVHGKGLNYHNNIIEQKY